ncbi:glycoside hydrolase superfamily [Geopyxis carbonaria]|nr:glycoside hydrolase superfamily [Geopyxis carbonaria]
MAPYAVSNGQVERPVRASSSRRHKERRERMDAEEETERTNPPRRSTHSRRNSTARPPTAGDATAGSTPRSSRPSTSGRTPRSTRNSTSGPRPTAKPSLTTPRAVPRAATAATASNSTPRSARDSSRSNKDSPARRPSRPTVTTVPRDPARTRRSERRDHPEPEREAFIPAEIRHHSRDAELDGAPDGIDRPKDKREGERKKGKKRKSAAGAAASAAHNKHHRSKSKDKRVKEKAALLGAGDEEQGPRERKKRLNCGKCFWLLVAASVLLLIILIPVGVLVIGKKKDNGANGDPALGLGKGGEESNIDSIDPSSIPTDAKGTKLDPFTWLDTKDFNLTYTAQTVGGLSVMGLFDDYDDSTRANSNVPPLTETFPYGKTPIRGVNVGGWLLVEPFITPSFFEGYSENMGVVDEYTLSKKLGPKTAKETMEKHYSTFVTETTFKEIRDAGLDHVRFPFGYWAVMTLEGDSFVPDVSWRYLLRGIEWARKYGLRVKLDLHSVPGGANGWNHSGREGVLGWLIGKNGDANGEKTLKIHTQLATFFAQPRYKNIVTMYGLVNEPKMITLDPDKVISWTEQAYDVVRAAGYKGQIIFGDGFRGLSKWKGVFAGKSGMLLDVHQYTIFNTNQLSLSHSDKIKFACTTWATEMESSLDTSTGFGPTMVGEWGQADTDCTKYLNNVGVGTRWEGNFFVESTGETIDKPSCNGGKNCSCEKANADPSDYSREYIQFLKTFAEAQMDSFEKGWGWMYWTWDTESATQWSYKKIAKPRSLTLHPLVSQKPISYFLV